MQNQTSTRAGWVDYLYSIGTLLKPEEIVDFANREIDTSQTFEGDFVRRFTAYFTLLAIDHEQELKNIFHEMGITQGMRVLDVGCGGGANGHFLLDLGVAEVIGLDSNDSVLEIASGLRQSNEHATHLHFIKHNVIEALPFTQNSFDAVLVANGYTDMFQAYALAEYRRVLRSDGRIIFTSTRSRKHYAWNVLIEQLMSYTLYLSMLETWGQDAFANEKRIGWDTMLSRARATLQMHVRSYIIDRTLPIQPITEMAVQHFFALMRGPTFKKYCGDQAKWHYVLSLHDPASSRY
ncbi:MAG: methyltransferase domain-containing protein, partial [Chloroflexota bacterium]